MLGNINDSFLICEDSLIKLFTSLSLRFARKVLADYASSLFTHRTSFGWILQESRTAFRDQLIITRRPQITSDTFLNCFRRAANIGSYHRLSGCHVLQNRIGEALGP